MHFDIALSFAGEDRKMAQELAHLLKSVGLIVFFDDDQQAELLGENLTEYLVDIYKNRASYCVVLLSEHYVQKRWTRHEWRAAQARAFEQFDQAYILPIRLDEAELPGLLPTTGYLSVAKSSLADIAARIAEKVAKSADLNNVHRIATAAFDRGDLERVCSLLGDPTLEAELSRNHAAYRLLADVRLMKGDVAEALVHFRKIVSFFPTDTEAWFQAGVCLTRLRMFSEAMVVYEKTLSIAPRHTAAKTDLAYVRIRLRLNSMPGIGRLLKLADSYWMSRIA